MTAIPVNLKRKVFIVVNPKSGSYREGNFTKTVYRVFKQSGVDFDIFYLERIELLDDSVKRAIVDGFNTFVAAGGDGTLALLANALRDKGILGIIPFGTGNAIARLLEVPFSLEEGLETVLSSPVVLPMDVMEINDRFFLMSTSMGFTSSLIRGVDTKRKSSMGRLAYVFAGFRQFFRSDIKSYIFNIDISGETLSLKAAELIVINAAPWGIPRFKIPGNRFDDGKVEVCIIPRGRFSDIVNTLLDMIFRERKVTLRFIGQGERISIDCSQQISVQADGDIITSTPVTITVIPQAVRVIVPCVKARERISKTVYKPELNTGEGLPEPQIRRQ